MSTCWLNSCLQLVLCAIDHNSNDHIFNSELGIELKQLQLNQSGDALDPTFVKDIIVTCEDTRIALRLSDLQEEILDEDELQRQSLVIRNFRLNLGRGQQCVRDFFVALNQNLLSWPDVYDYLAFQMVTSTTCPNCGNRRHSEATQIYEEIDVPPDQSNLKSYAENLFNGSTTVESLCYDGCNRRGQGIRKTELKSTRDSNFIILILSRAVNFGERYQLVRNRVTCTDAINIR